jgi:CBS domain-containing protein
MWRKKVNDPEWRIWPSTEMPLNSSSAVFASGINDRRYDTTDSSWSRSIESRAQRDAPAIRDTEWVSMAGGVAEAGRLVAELRLNGDLARAFWRERVMAVKTTKARTKAKINKIKTKSKTKSKTRARPKATKSPTPNVVLCGDVMTRDVITVSPECTLSELCRVLAEDDISGAPVVDHRGDLIGIVSKTDVLRDLLSGRLVPGLPRATLNFLGLAEAMSGAAEDSEDETFGQVADFMTDEVETVTPDTPITEAARAMTSNRIHRLIVVDQGKVVGIITSLDLLKQL